MFRHALCWIHAERNINKLVPLNDTHAKQIAWVRCQIWDLYADLKAYKTDPRLQNPTFQEEIRQRFRELCRTRTAYQTLNGHLKRLLASQDELLRVLEDPRLPLHNNLSERDIREYVKRRKISGLFTPLLRQGSERAVGTPVGNRGLQIKPRRVPALAAGVDDAGEQGENPRAGGGSGAVTELAQDHPMPQGALGLVVGEGEPGWCSTWKMASQSLSSSTAKAWVLT